MQRMLQWIRMRSLTDVYLVLMAFMIPWQSFFILRRMITPFHVINVFFIVLFLSLLRIKGFKWYFAVPFMIYMLGGFLGMFNSQVILLNLYTIGQDIYLYLWFGILCLLLRSEQRTERLVTAWICAIFLILALSVIGLGMDWSGRRAELSFSNPNRAGSYFAASIFFLLHPVVPWVWKVVGAVGMTQTVRSTGSAGSLMMIPIGGVIFLWAWLYVRTPRGLRAFQHLGFALLATVCVYTSSHWMGLDLVRRIVDVGDTAGAGARGVDSAISDRSMNWAAGMEEFRDHPWGIGPLSWQYQVEQVHKEKPKGAHSDFLATLVERGVVGFIGLILFMGAVALTILKMLRDCARREDRRRGVWAAALAGAFVAHLSYGGTHEMLHHETFWVLLALIVSNATLVARRQQPAVAARVARPVVGRGIPPGARGAPPGSTRAELQSKSSRSTD